MFSTFDWQNLMAERTEAVQSRLRQALPVIAMSVEEGVLFATLQRQSPKLFEIYDRLVMGAIGLQSDVDALRMAAIDFAHQEGFNRSEDDVTIQRVAQALSPGLKRAFGDVNTVPIIARMVFGQVGKNIADDVFYLLHHDGDFEVKQGPVIVAATEEEGKELAAKLPSSTKLPEVRQALEAVLAEFASTRDEEVTDAKFVAALLSRSNEREQRFGNPYA